MPPPPPIDVQQSQAAFPAGDKRQETQIFTSRHEKSGKCEIQKKEKKEKKRKREKEICGPRIKNLEMRN
jgi:hypothetical protein